MIKVAELSDSTIVAELAVLLWTNHEIKELEEEIKEYIAYSGGVIFIYFSDSIPVAFAQCVLRNDYVEGTESSPVGYLEGIFVRLEYRNRGIAKKLLMSCEEWSKKNQCMEFASDCELTNWESLKFHLKVGFIEANRIICFKKKL